MKSKHSIKSVNINQCNSAPYNPRVDLKPGDPAFEKLRKSIETFGFVEPIIVNERTNHIIGGHQRMAVLQYLGHEMVDAVVVDFLLEEEKALNLAMNKITGEWDEDKLHALLDELSVSPDMDLSLTGFDIPEISDILDENVEEITGDDFIVAISEKQTPITQRGEIIQLGNHRIMCGDVACQDDLTQLLGDVKVKLIYTDAPYAVAYDATQRPIKKSNTSKTAQWREIESDNLKQEDYEVWLGGVFKNIFPLLDKGGCYYLWQGHRQFIPMYRMLLDLGMKISTVITWMKESISIGYADYSQQTEFCLYGWKENNGAHNWYGPTNESTLWRINRESQQLLIHPTQKPVALAKRALRNSSLCGNIVFDGFLGSGSTLIAAEQLGRICYGMDIDPLYVDEIVRRYIRLVGKDRVDIALYERFMAGEEASHA